MLIYDVIVQEDEQIKVLLHGKGCVIDFFGPEIPDTAYSLLDKWRLSYSIKHKAAGKKLQGVPAA